MASNYGLQLLSINYELLRGTVVFCLGQLGCLGSFDGLPLLGRGVRLFVCAVLNSKHEAEVDAWMKSSGSLDLQGLRKS